MTGPQTPFELGTASPWTFRDAETAFLQQVAAETTATLTTAGQSVNGRAIHRVDLGSNPDQTLLITSLIHGNEPASREALLTFLRDLAYSTDPGILDYLNNHRIVALTPCNPDGFWDSRMNANRANINRDFYRLTQPETRVIVQTINDVQPHMTLDIHEYQGSPGQPDWMGRAGGNPLTHPLIQAQEQACYDYGEATLQGLGYTTQPYWINALMRAGMSTLAGPTHSVGVLSETNTAYDPSERVHIQRQILDLFREWHGDNAAACTAAVEASRAAARTTNDPVPLFTHEFFGYDTNPEMIHVLGYQLHEPMPEFHRQAFGITVTEAGFVPMMQDAQWVIPTLCDPNSTDVIVAASRVPVQAPTTPKQPLPSRGSLVAIHAQAGGRLRQIGSVKVKTETGTLRGLRFLGAQ